MRLRGVLVGWVMVSVLCPAALARAATPAADAVRAEVAFSGPALASGWPEHHVEITMSLTDAGGEPVPGLAADDFDLVLSGRENILDWSTFRESADAPGTYHIQLRSTAAENKFLDLYLRGRLLYAGGTARDQAIRFLPGVYGWVRDDADQRGLEGIRVTLAGHDGTERAAADTDAEGRYALFLADTSDFPLTPGAVTFQLRGEDPLDNYAPRDVPVAVTSLTAVRQDLYLAFQPAEAAGGRLYPNPARRGQTVTLDYRLIREADVTVEVYDLRGRRILTLVDGRRRPGRHRVTWDARNRFGRVLAPGTYTVAMRLGTEERTQTFVIVP